MNTTLTPSPSQLLKLDHVWFARADQAVAGDVLERLSEESFGLSAIHTARLAVKSKGTKPAIGFRFSYFVRQDAKNGRWTDIKRKNRLSQPGGGRRSRGI